jgi:hypothetical protein
MVSTAAGEESDHYLLLSGRVAERFLDEYTAWLDAQESSGKHEPGTSSIEAQLLDAIREFVRWEAGLE